MDEVARRELYDEDTKELIYQINFKVQVAMLTLTIPSTRAVCIEFNPKKAIAGLVFFHDGEEDEYIEELYSIIESEASCSPWMWGKKDVRSEPYIDPSYDGFKVVFLKYPNPIPEEKYLATIYHRREPFEDPV